MRKKGVRVEMKGTDAMPSRRRVNLMGSIIFMVKRVVQRVMAAMKTALAGGPKMSILLF